MIDNKVTLLQTTFSSASLKKLTDNKLNRLRVTAKDLFDFINELGKLHNVRGNVRVYMLKDHIKKTKTDTCAVLQLCSNGNLFSRQYDRAIMNCENLTKSTVY